MIKIEKKLMVKFKGAVRLPLAILSRGAAGRMRFVSGLLSPGLAAKTGCVTPLYRLVPMQAMDLDRIIPEKKYGEVPALSS